MSRVISPVSGKPYGLAAVCRAWRLARSGVYRHQRTMLQPQRRGPLGAMSDDGLTAGIQAHPQATRFQALEPIRQGVRQRFGGFGKAIARGLAVRHDHGSQYMSHHFQTEIAFLGIESSPAFVRAPEGNGCAERFIRTLKENLLWVRSFDTIEELRQALLEFRQTYNATWLIERHGFLTPAQFRQKQLQTAAIAA